jgi:hypothetical protein
MGMQRVVTLEVLVAEVAARFPAAMALLRNMLIYLAAAGESSTVCMGFEAVGTLQRVNRSIRIRKRLRFHGVSLSIRSRKRLWLHWPKSRELSFDGL